MLTQQELIDRLNQLTLRYNLTWFDIKYDADKAIDKINAFMGTTYPKLSEHFIAPESTYSITTSGIAYEIIPEEYFHSIIIPYIAMEVLARDEEFTTIYNKYDLEVKDGLFNMFQKEFNRVPYIFRQNPDQGVFFASDSAEGHRHHGHHDHHDHEHHDEYDHHGHRIHHNDRHDLPSFKFRVYYHINNSDIVLGSGTSTKFIEDTRAYEYNDTATIKGWNIDLLSLDGVYAYHFTGWYRNKSQVTGTAIAVGESLTINSDVHLYANWSITCTLSNTLQGVVTIKPEYKVSLSNLVIPEKVNNITVLTIPSFFIGLAGTGNIRADNLQTIVLPPYLTTISANAFSGFQGTSIVLPETVISSTYLGISIGGSAFAMTPNISNIIIPANVIAMDQFVFPYATKTLTIYCRILESNKPALWNTLWAAAAVPGWFELTKVWGYNG